MVAGGACGADRVESDPAQRGHDGRGPPTILYEKLTRVLGIERLVDVMDFYFAETYQVMDLARLCPVVFEAADEGDGVAVGILEHAGREAALSATVIAPDCTTADGLATATFVLGAEDGRKLVDLLEGVEVMFLVRESGEIRQIRTRGFPAVTDLSEENLPFYEEARPAASAVEVQEETEAESEEPPDVEKDANGNAK